MKSFTTDGDVEIAYIDEGEGRAVLFIHGFASTAQINWQGPSWIKTMVEDGYRTIALDNRGHGQSTKFYDPDDYRPGKMAEDALALMDHLEIGKAHIIGYSMGARIAAFLAMNAPDRVLSLVFGGMGDAMYRDDGQWEVIAEALTAPSLEDVTNERGRVFRAFADQTGSDRKALAACIARSREIVDEEALAGISIPALVAVGDQDDIAGSPAALADVLGNAQAFVIANRDHMRSVGDPRFKRRVKEFLANLQFEKKE